MPFTYFRRRLKVEFRIELGRRSENNVRDAVARNGARRHENNARQRPRRRSSAPPAGGRFFNVQGFNIHLEIVDFFDHVFFHHGRDSSPEPVIDPEDVSSPSEEEMLNTNVTAGRRRLPRRRARQNASEAIHSISMSGRRATRSNNAAGMKGFTYFGDALCPLLLRATNISEIFS